MIVAYYRWAKDLRKCWIGSEQIVVAIQNNEKKDDEKVLVRHVKALLLSYFSILLSEKIISCL